MLQAWSLLLRSSAEDPPRFSGPAFVVGSGPNARLPADYDQTWTLATVNASQVNAASLGCGTPDLTLFGRAVLGSKPVNLEAQTVLRGAKTGTAIGFRGRQRYSMIRIKLAMINYTYDRFHYMTRTQRLKIVSDAVGDDASDMGHPSNGVFLALLCLHLGSSFVVMSGFSFTRNGHSYNDKERERRHTDEDRALLRIALARGAQIFSSDPIFAAESGLPLFAPGARKALQNLNEGRPLP
jgi:hypothetical protein